MPFGFRTMLKKLINDSPNPSQTMIDLKERIPIGRLANPIEQAKVIVFLLSEDSNYIMGSFIDSNGGLY